MSIVNKNLLRGMLLSLVSLSTAQADSLHWINHFDLISGDPHELILSSHSTSSGIGDGLTGVVVKSTSVGSKFSDGGHKVAHMALQLPVLPLGMNVRGVRVCYELSGKSAYISQIRIDEVQNPPSRAIVKLDDATHLTAKGPVCVNSKATNIATNNGPLLFSLRFNFASTTDAIVIRGLGFYLG